MGYGRERREEHCPHHYAPFGAPKTLTTDKIEELAKLLRAYAS
jgi:hypothetical protein